MISCHYCEYHKKTFSVCQASGSNPASLLSEASYAELDRPFPNAIKSYRIASRSLPFTAKVHHSQTIGRQSPPGPCTSAISILAQHLSMIARTYHGRSNTWIISVVAIDPHTVSAYSRVFASGLSDALGKDPLQICCQSLISLNTENSLCSIIGG